VRLLLDTHVLLWITLEAPRLRELPWLDRYRPWGVSPITLLEIRFLAETGRLEIRRPGFGEAVAGDPRFVLDEVPLVPLVEKAVGLSWTRDPFDRLLAAHSEARRVPLATLDRYLRAHHRLLPEELRT
jgi:PIN domain nuclease of toxin-antitoxin system